MAVELGVNKKKVEREKERGSCFVLFFCKVIFLLFFSLSSFSPFFYIFVSLPEPGLGLARLKQQQPVESDHERPRLVVEHARELALERPRGTPPVERVRNREVDEPCRLGRQRRRRRRRRRRTADDEQLGELVGAPAAEAGLDALPLLPLSLELLLLRGFCCCCRCCRSCCCCYCCCVASLRGWRRPWNLFALEEGILCFVFCFFGEKKKERKEKKKSVRKKKQRQKKYKVQNLKKMEKKRTQSSLLDSA